MSIAELECVTDGARAAALLQHPLRRRLLARAGEPVSATELARQLGLTRQAVNYHVRQLVKAGFLKPAGRRLRRNLVERQYVATARSYVLAPQLLGPVAAGVQSDAFSASYLLGLTSLAQQELTEVWEAASAAGVRVLTMSLMSEVRFATAAQRAEFAQALTAAVSEVVARHTNPFRTTTGEAGAGRPYRLVLGCYPIPREEAQP
jgi:DNA-binding MarR family transcriptional regulator